MSRVSPPIADRLERLSKLTNSLSGSDKILRLYTYASLYLTPAPTGYVSTISSARMVFRLTGIVAVLNEVKILLKGGMKMNIESFLGLIKTVSMLGFYPAEACFWIASHFPKVRKKITGVRSLDKGKKGEEANSTSNNSTVSEEIELREPELWGLDTTEWSRYSCQFWLIYIIADILDLIVKLNRIPSPTTTSRPAPSPASSSAVVSMRRLYMLMLVYEFLDLPLAVTWSTKKGVLSTKNIGIFGTLGSALALYMSWKATA